MQIIAGILDHMNVAYEYFFQTCSYFSRKIIIPEERIIQERKVVSQELETVIYHNILFSQKVLPLYRNTKSAIKNAQIFIITLNRSEECLWVVQDNVAFVNLKTFFKKPKPFLTRLLVFFSEHHIGQWIFFRNVHKIHNKSLKSFLSILWRAKRFNAHQCHERTLHVYSFQSFACFPFNRQYFQLYWTLSFIPNYSFLRFFHYLLFWLFISSQFFGKWF